MPTPHLGGSRRVTLAFLQTFKYATSLPAFPGGSEVKASASNAGDPGSIPGLGRSPGEGNDNPLQYPCLENLMDRGAWWAAVHGVAKSQMRLSLSLASLVAQLVKNLPAVPETRV